MAFRQLCQERIISDGSEMIEKVRVEAGFFYKWFYDCRLKLFWKNTRRQGQVDDL